MKKRMAIILCFCLAISVMACSQHSTKEPASMPSRSVNENPQTSYKQESENEAAYSLSTAEKADKTITAARGVATDIGDKRYTLPIEAVLGTVQDKQNMSELVADMGNVVAYLYVASMDVVNEHDLTQEETAAIISLLQNAPISVYTAMRNPSTGGYYFNLVAYKADDNAYLHMAFDGDRILFHMPNENRTLIFNGENSGLEAIEKIITAENSSSQAIPEPDIPSPTPARIGEPDNFTELPKERIQMLPFSEKQVKEIDFDTLPPKYGVFTSLNPNKIKEIIGFINEIQIGDSKPSVNMQASIVINFHLQDGTKTEVQLFENGIMLNNDPEMLYSVVDKNKYTQLESLLDNFVMKYYEDKGLLSVKGTVIASEQTETHTFLYEIDTAYGIKTMKIKQGINTVILLNVQACYPFEKNQPITVFYEEESNPLIPVVVFAH